MAHMLGATAPRGALNGPYSSRRPLTSALPRSRRAGRPQSHRGSSCRHSPQGGAPRPFAPHSRLQDYPLQPLVDDCRLLGSLLDDCLRIEVGEELFQKVGAERGTALQPAARRRCPRCRPGACLLRSRPAANHHALLRLRCACTPASPQIERIRTLSDCAQQLSSAHDKEAGRFLGQKMAEELFALPLEEALPILRAYGHYLK